MDLTISTATGPATWEGLPYGRLISTVRRLASDDALILRMALMEEGERAREVEGLWEDG